MNFYLVTLFPDFFRGALKSSLIGRAAKKGRLSFKVINLRRFTRGKHQVADDAPYGGGAGMVLKPEPFFRLLTGLKGKLKGSRRVILLTPQGRTFDQRMARRLAKYRNLVFLCGHYEGVDERVAELAEEEISIGDFVLSGGEAAALVMIEAVARLKKGVLGNEKSAVSDSFGGSLLDYPHYTRPGEFSGKMVPRVLLSGHHRRIGDWREREALRRTLWRRPDLLAQADLTVEQQDRIREIFTEEE